MSKLYTLLNTLVAKVNVSVKTTTQVLTEDQKEQARTNIGAVSASETITVTGIDADGVSHSWTMYGVKK